MNECTLYTEWRIGKIARSKNLRNLNQCEKWSDKNAYTFHVIIMSMRSDEVCIIM